MLVRCFCNLVSLPTMTGGGVETGAVINVPYLSIVPPPICEYVICARPHICKFWYTTALVWPINVHRQMRKFATK